jgi:2-haloacid dehalogenase
VTTTVFEPLAIKAMIFDTFGTVVDWRGSIISEGDSYWTPVKGVKVDDWATFADAWRSKYGPFMNKVRTGELPWTKLDDLHRMSLDEVLVDFDVTNLSETDREHLNFVWHRLNPWPDAPSGLARLKCRYVITPLSNGNLSLLTEMAKFAGLPWDCILGADLFRRFKPDPEIYLGASDILGFEPSQVMMTAAHPGDLEAARKIGLRTAYVHRPLEHGPGMEHAMPATGDFDVVATDFRDMASQLGL